MMAIVAGDPVCLDVTAARQLPVQGYEAMLTDDIADIWLPGTVTEVRADGRYVVDLESARTGPARFLAHIDNLRARGPDGDCAS